MTTSIQRALASASGLLLLTGFAAAQTTPEDGRVLEEVVVRAQKTAEAQSVQRVPLAVTAISAETIAATQAVNIVEISRLSPNTTFTTAATTPGFANFQIRGIGNSGSTGTIDPAVNIVVDGMVYDFQGGTVLDAFDLESVEILRGPQGVLAGRNTTGGAVLLRTRRPAEEFGVLADVTVGNFDRIDASASIEGPLVADQLFGKLAIMKRTREGSFEDNNGGQFAVGTFNPSGLQPATLDETQPDLDNLVVKPTLLWKPSDTLDVSLLAEYATIEGGSSAAQPVDSINPVTGLRYDAPLIARFGYTQPGGEWADNNNFEGFSDITSKRIIAEVNWDVGPGVVTSITGYRDVDYQFGFDSDGTPFIILEFPEGNRSESEQYSEELRFASTFSDTVDFVVGAYFDHHELDTVERRRQSNLVAAPTATTYTVARIQGAYSQEAESVAGFFNVNWHPVEKLTLTAGGRYSREEKEITISPLDACTGAGGTEYSGCSTIFDTFDKSWSDFSPKGGVQYQWNDDVLTYLTWTKGFRSGVFNGRAANGAAGRFVQVGPTDPESAASTEIGVKATFWDDRARVNFAAFNTKYEDIIRTVLVGAFQAPQNAASAKINGVEVEAVLRPLPFWELSGNVGWTDAEFDEFAGINLDGQPGISPTDLALAKELEFDKVPEFTAYAATAFFFDVMGAATAARISYSWRDDYFVDVPNSAFAEQDAYGTLDASFSAEWGSYKLTLFGKNLTDEHAIELANALFVPIQYGGEARTYGVTIGYHY